MYLYIVLQRSKIIFNVSRIESSSIAMYVASYTYSLFYLGVGQSRFILKDL